MKKKYIKTILFIITLILLDQLSKLLIIKFFNVNEGINIIKGFLKLFYIKNTGAAFGMLSGNIFLLSMITIILIYYLIKELKNNMSNKLSRISFALILSGAIGNLIDRVFRKYVVDFISFTLFNHEMAIFNIADSYITIGVILLMYVIFKEGKNAKNSSK